MKAAFEVILEFKFLLFTLSQRLLRLVNLQFLVSSQSVATAIAGAKFVKIGQRGGGCTALKRMGTRKISVLLTQPCPISMILCFKFKFGFFVP